MAARMPALLPGRHAIDDMWGHSDRNDDIGAFLGLHVGKTAHHGHGMTPARKKSFDKHLPNSEPKLRAVFEKQTAELGMVPVAVNQPASIGALPEPS